AHGRRRHTGAPGEPPGEDPFPGWPNHLLDGLLQGGAWLGLMMFGSARWKGFPHWLQYLLVFFYFLSALVALDLLTLLAYALALLSRGKGPLRRNEHPHPLKDSRPVRGGPASGGTTPNKFFQDWVRARGRHSSRRPHELLAIIEEGMVRMQRKPGSTLPATRKGGQVYLYGAVLHCADPSLRQRLENARERAAHLAREWEAVIPPDIAAVSYHCTGVEEGLVLNLEKALPYQGFLLGLACLFGRTLGGAHRLLRSMSRAIGIDLLGAWRCRERRTAAGAGRPRDRQLESESEGPTIGTRGGDRLGWRPPGSTLGTLGLRAPCPEPPDEGFTLLLVEDEPQSDVTGWERLGGRVLAPLCARHKRMYRLARQHLLCAFAGPPSCDEIGTLQ
ncbi:unnamed protein product, partial [Prorocentrum cordatum]